jgi:Na+/melibiose symporter-like transporter
MSNRSSLFSLSGFTGILTGVLGCIAIFLVNTMTDGYGYYFDGFSQLPILFIEIGIIVISVLIIILSLFIIWKRGKNKAKKNQQKLWDSNSKKQRFNLLVVLFIFLAVLIFIAHKGYYSFITPILLAFYGLLLLNLSRLESKSLLPLALAHIILALIAYLTNNNEILLLAIGVGVLPILYGVLTLSKSKKAIEN